MVRYDNLDRLERRTEMFFSDRGDGCSNKSDWERLLAEKFPTGQRIEGNEFVSQITNLFMHFLAENRFLRSQVDKYKAQPKENETLVKSAEQKLEEGRKALKLADSREQKLMTEKKKVKEEWENCCAMKTENEKNQQEIAAQKEKIDKMIRRTEDQYDQLKLSTEKVKKKQKDLEELSTVLLKAVDKNKMDDQDIQILDEELILLKEQTSQIEGRLEAVEAKTTVEDFKYLEKTLRERKEELKKIESRLSLEATKAEPDNSKGLSMKPAESIGREKQNSKNETVSKQKMETRDISRSRDLISRISQLKSKIFISVFLLCISDSESSASKS